MRVVRDSADFGFGAVENGQNQSGLGGFDRTGQRIHAARMHNPGQHRFKASATLDHTFKPMLGDLALLSRRWRLNFQDRGRHDPPRRVRALAIQHDDALIRAFLPRHELYRHGGGNRQRPLDLYLRSRGSNSPAPEGLNRPAR